MNFLEQYGINFLTFLTLVVLGAIGWNDSRRDIKALNDENTRKKEEKEKEALEFERLKKEQDEKIKAVNGWMHEHEEKAAGYRDVFNEKVSRLEGARDVLGEQYKQLLGSMELMRKQIENGFDNLTNDFDDIKERMGKLESK